MPLSKARTEALFRALDRANPHPKSDLHFENEFQLLVAVLLSAQATDKGVNRVTPHLFAAAPNPTAMVELGVEGIASHIKSLGLFNNKAKNLFACCQALIAQHGGQIPRDRKALTQLAGVGNKTAGVVMNVAFGEPCIPVDTHVFRVANRLGLVCTKTPDATEAALLKVVPEWVKVKAHHLLILHGRYTCKSRQPACSDCVVQEFCQSFSKPS